MLQKWTYSAGGAKVSVVWVLALGIVCAAQAEAEPGREARWFQGRRMYDQRIEFHPVGQGSPSLPEPEEKPDRSSPPERPSFFLDTSLHVSPPTPHPPPAARRRRPGADDDDEDERDGTWLLRPVTGVSEESLMAEVLTGWGWLAEQVVKANRQQADDAEGDDAETEEEEAARLYGLIFGDPREADGDWRGREDVRMHPRNYPSLLARDEPVRDGGGLGFFFEDNRRAETSSADVGELASRRDDFRSRGLENEHAPFPELRHEADSLDEDREAGAWQAESGSSSWSFSERADSARDVSMSRHMSDPMAQLSVPLDPAARSWDNGWSSGRWDRGDAGSLSDPGFRAPATSSSGETAMSFSGPDRIGTTPDSGWASSFPEPATRVPDSSSAWNGGDSLRGSGDVWRSSEPSFTGDSFPGVPDGSSFRW